MREAVRRVASSASNGSENSNFDCTDFRSQERPARRILARSRSEAGASLGECDFNESHRKFSESFNENSFRQNSADFDAEGWRSRGGVGSGPNSHGSGAQKEGRGGRGGVGAGPEPMPTVVDGATDVCWGRLEQQQAACMVPHLPNEECSLQPADMVSNKLQKVQTQPFLLTVLTISQDDQQLHPWEPFKYFYVNTMETSVHCTTTHLATSSSPNPIFLSQLPQPMLLQVRRCLIILYNCGTRYQTEYSSCDFQHIPKF